MPEAFEVRPFDCSLGRTAGFLAGLISQHHFLVHSRIEKHEVAQT
jgi:hypothetical protein